MQRPVSKSVPLDPALARTLELARGRAFPKRDVLDDRAGESRMTPAEQSDEFAVKEALRKSGGDTYAASVLIGMSRFDPCAPDSSSR